MKRNSFLKNLGAAAAVAAVPQYLQAKEARGVEPVEKGIIVHSVYFWLKPGLSSDELKDFLNFFEALKKVPGIASYAINAPAPTTKRDVVDNSFAYHWLAFFKNMEDITTYEKHPNHLAAAEKFSKYWVKVEVKDSIVQESK